MKVYMQFGCVVEGFVWLCFKMDVCLGFELFDMVYKYELDVYGIDDVVVLMCDQICCQLLLMVLMWFVEVEVICVFEVVGSEVFVVVDVVESVLVDFVEVGSNVDIQCVQDFGVICDLL